MGRKPANRADAFELRHLRYFTTLVDALQRKGRKVSVVSTMATQPAMIADDLRRQADHFIDLMTLKAEIGRDPNERPARHAEGPETV